MAAKAVGEFSFKLVASRNSPGPAGSPLIEVSWEGTGTGLGVTFVTATYVGSPKGGSYSTCGVAYLDNGDGLTTMGQGTHLAGLGGGRRGARSRDLVSIQ
jgi:hypothetical protein